MSHLLAISVGPVQEFIAAARRTRDLWFGSYLLSEISRAVAQAVERQDGKLIFPASSAAKNVANVILAELPASDPRAIAAQAREAAHARWREFAEPARREVSGFIRSEIWEDQVADVIEFHAAWVPRSDDYKYKADRARLMRLLAGRKSCRDFIQPEFPDTGLPKSSLDGQRPTVLVGPKREELRKDYRAGWPKKLRLAEGEQLDVVGVTKRLGKKQGEPDPRYPSVARVAAETWLRGFEKGKLQPLIVACEKLVAQGLNNMPEERYADFPFEGTVIYRDRHFDLKNELALGPNDLKEVAQALNDLGGKPSPYLAVLKADGDKIGGALSQLDSPDRHRKFSEALAGFGDAAERITNEHNGVLIYAGGDDVLAFLPVGQCLDCARELHDDFAAHLQEYGAPTLSVGLAIGHFMENLEDLLEYGRAAEKAAKEPDRDGLAVHLYKRGGGPIKVRARWTEDPSPDDRLIDFARLILVEAIPSKLPYELRNLARLYEHWPPETVADALRRDVLRVVRDKQPRSGRAEMPRIEETLKRRVDSPETLVRFAEELLVARHIADAWRQSGEGPAPAPEASS